MNQESTLRIGVDSRQAVAGAAAADRSIERVGNTAVATEGRVGGLTRGLAAMGAGFAALGGVRAVIGTLAEFEQSLSTVQAVSGASAEGMKSLREEAKRLGSETRFSASEAADAMVNLGRAGFNTEQILGSVGSTLTLAQAGGLGLAEASDITVKALNGFRLGVEESGRVADVLAFAAGNAATDVAQLGEGIKFVAPVAQGMNVSLEQSVAALSKLSDAGLQGSTAGTGLRRVLSSLASVTPKAEAVLDLYGIKAAEVDPQVVGLTGALKRLGEENVNIADLLQIFGDRGGPASQVLKSLGGDLDSFIVALEQAEGTAQTMSDTMDNNLNGALLRVRSAFEAVIISSGDAGITAGSRAAFEALAIALRTVADHADILIPALGLLAVRGLAPIVGSLLLVRTGLLANVTSMTAYTAAAFRATAASAAVATGGRLAPIFYQAAGAFGAAATGARALGASLLSLLTGPTAVILGLGAAYIYLSGAAERAKQAQQNVSAAFDLIANARVSDEVKDASAEYARLVAVTGSAEGALRLMNTRQQEAIRITQAQTKAMQAQALLRRNEQLSSIQEGIRALEDQRAAAESAHVAQSKFLRGRVGVRLEAFDSGGFDEQIQILRDGAKALEEGLLEFGNVNVPSVADAVDAVTLVDKTQIDTTVDGIKRVTQSLEEAMLVLSAPAGFEREFIQNMLDAGLDPYADRATEAGQNIRKLTEELALLEDAEDKRLAQEREANREIDRKIRTYQDFIDEIDTQTESYRLDAQLREARIGAARIEQDLKRSDIALTQDQVSELERKLILQQQEQELARVRDSIYQDTTQAANEYLLTEQALHQLRQDGLISQDQFNQRLRDAQSTMLDLKIQAGDASFAEGFLGALDRMSAGARNRVGTISNTFEGFFGSLSQGFGDSIGRAIVFSEDLGSALLDVARNAASQLISSLVQFGIQLLINAAIGKAVASAAVASSATQAAALATAWAPAAAFASLATLGTNAAPAAAAVAGTTALAASVGVAASAAGAVGAGFMTGGYTGDGPINAPAGIVHGQEFVVKAGAAAANRPLLEAINAGRSVSSRAASAAAGAGTASSGTQLVVDVGGITVTEQEGEDAAVTGQRMGQAVLDKIIPVIDQRLQYHRRSGGLLK